jgi:small subunit ribosomal protein SAe
MSKFPQVLAPSEEDIKRMLAVGLHLGSQNIEQGMNRYVWRRRSDGVHIINIAKTWEKIILAARVIAGIENPSDVVVISGPKAGHRAVLKFHKYTGAHAISGRYTPGTFTNQIQAKFMEPRLLLVADPRADHQALRESTYVNVPTIALCNIDSPLRNVDIAIPCNNRSTQSVALVFWLIAREVQYLKGQLSRTHGWDVMVDTFFFRTPEEINAERKAVEEAAQAQAQADLEAHYNNANQAETTWNAQGSENTWDAAAENWQAGQDANAEAEVATPEGFTE